MMQDITNDNDAARVPDPDAHGHAALLLAESLIHTLVARSVISVADAIETVDLAVETRAEIAIDTGDPLPTTQRSSALLAAIRDSLKIDDRDRDA